MFEVYTCFAFDATVFRELLFLTLLRPLHFDDISWLKAARPVENCHVISIFLEGENPADSRTVGSDNEVIGGSCLGKLPQVGWLIDHQGEWLGRNDVLSPCDFQAFQESFCVFF